MKKNVFLLVLAVITQTALAQQAITIKNSDPLVWQGKAALGGYSPEGTLEIDKAIITVDDNQISALVVSVDMTSLTQENKRLEGHLRDADFFDVKVFTKAVFTLVEPITLDNGESQLKGIMTIKNKSINETIPAQINITDKLVIIEFDGQFDRTEYGITYNSPSFFTKLKDQAIANEFSLKGKLSFPRRF